MKNVKNMKKFLALIPVIFFLSACSKTPMEKLQSNNVYPDMTEKFWIAQFNLRKQKPLWHEAAEYCMGHSDKPNCDPVNKVFMCSGDCLKKAPPIGHSGESIHLEG